jgi:hypothetical protein
MLLVLVSVLGSLHASMAVLPDAPEANGPDIRSHFVEGPIPAEPASINVKCDSNMSHLIYL